MFIFLLLLLVRSPRRLNRVELIESGSQGGKQLVELFGM